jgi:replication-associated recombination protein RarA
MLDFTPKSTNEMVFSCNRTKNLLNDILQHNVSFPSNGKNVLMLYGTFGSGKTTYANLFLNEYERSFGGDEAYINKVKVDGNAKITSTIDRISNTANLCSFSSSNKHFFLFDEIDGYKLEQQQRLKGWLNRNDIVCVMTTNYLHKIDKGLQSRCHVLDFNASSNMLEYVNRMKQILRQQSLPMLDDSSLFNIADLHKGDWREICASLERACSRASSSATTKTKLNLV